MTVHLEGESLFVSCREDHQGSAIGNELDYTLPH